MRDFLKERPRLPLLKAVRVVIVIPILINFTLLALAVYVARKALHLKYPKAMVTSVFILEFATLVRLIWVIINGFIQARTASVMIVEKPAAVSIEGKSGNRSIEEARWVSIATFILDTLLLPSTQGMAT